MVVENQFRVILRGSLCPLPVPVRKHRGDPYRRAEQGSGSQTAVDMQSAHSSPTSDSLFLSPCPHVTRRTWVPCPPGSGNHQLWSISLWPAFSCHTHIYLFSYFKWKSIYNVFTCYLYYLYSLKFKSGLRRNKPDEESVPRVCSLSSSWGRTLQKDRSHWFFLLPSVRGGKRGKSPKSFSFSFLGQGLTQPPFATPAEGGLNLALHLSPRKNHTTTSPERHVRSLRSWLSSLETLSSPPGWARKVAA